MRLTNPELEPERRKAGRADVRDYDRKRVLPMRGCRACPHVGAGTLAGRAADVLS